MSDADDYRREDRRRIETDTFTKIAVTVMGALIAAGVLGIWSMSQSVTRLEERVASWTNIFERRMETFADEQREQNKRINGMENNLTRSINRIDNIEADHRKFMRQPSPP